MKIQQKIQQCIAIMRSRFTDCSRKYAISCHNHRINHQCQEAENRWEETWENFSNFKPWSFIKTMKIQQKTQQWVIITWSNKKWLPGPVGVWQTGPLEQKFLFRNSSVYGSILQTRPKQFETQTCYGWVSSCASIRHGCAYDWTTPLASKDYAA